MNILKIILSEQRSFDYRKVIADAIKNRRKISFYYNGPQKPKKDSVRPGRRILVEPITLGLTKKGNMAFKGFVQPPSVTKTGFEKHGWRTFLLYRIHRLELSDETFDRRPDYKDTDDKSFSKVIAKTDFTKKSRIYKYDQPVYTKLGRKPIEKTKAPELEPVKPTTEPGSIPVEPKVKPTVEPTVEPIIKPEIGIEKKPEEPVRVDKEELPQPKVKEGPPVNPEEDEGKEEDKNLQEQINRIKSLMFKLKVL